MRRSLGSALLVALGATLLTTGVLAMYLRDTLVDSGEFADRAATAVAAPEVRAALTNEIVDQLTDAEAELLQVRPLLVSVVDAALQSGPTIAIVEAAVADLHRTLFTMDSDTVTLELAELVLVTKIQLTALDPELGALVPDDLTDAIVSVKAEQFIVDTVQFAEDLRFLAFLLPVAAVVAFVAAVWVSPDPRGTSVAVGLCGPSVALAVLLAERVARRGVIGDDGDIAGAVWDAFLAELSTWALILAGAGAVVAFVASTGVDEFDIADLAARFGRVVRRRASRWARAGWGLGATLLGLLLVVEWHLAVRLSVTVVGAAVVAAGLREILVALVPAVAAPRVRTEGARATAHAGGGWLRVTVAGLGAAVVIAVIIGNTRSADGGEVALDPGCNGSVTQCERTLEEVVLAATHNSNAAARDDYLNGYQTVGIVPQLEDGVRGLLFDVYFGLAGRGDVVVTDRAPLTPEERELYVSEIGEQAVLAAEALVERNEDAGGTRDLYLCHAFCELGATPFVGELSRIREFLEMNPREVLVLIIQDEGPRPADVAEAFEESGMLDLVYRHDADAGFPTLREMIAQDTRVLVTAENVSGEFDWYHDAFTLIQDTPFSFESVDDFSCDQNRGTEDSPLLLANHWLSPVSPTAADEANDAAVLMARVEDCIDARGIRPNLLAVDFHDRGNLLEVVAELNQG